MLRMTLFIIVIYFILFCQYRTISYS